jgi:hypothetical protein
LRENWEVLILLGLVEIVPDAIAPVSNNLFSSKTREAINHEQAQLVKKGAFGGQAATSRRGENSGRGQAISEAR